MAKGANKTPPNQRQTVIILISAVLVAMGAIALAWWFVQPERGERNDFVRNAAQIAGAISLGLGLYYTHRTVDNSQKTLDHAKESQKAERFFKASEQLGNKDSEDVRIAALYSLERLSKDSDDYYSQVIEVICAFIRRRSDELGPVDFNDSDSDPSPAEMPKTSHDIAAAMTVLERRAYRQGDGESVGLDLRGANLCGLSVFNADFVGSTFEGALMIGSPIGWSHFHGVLFRDADLRRARFINTSVISANFSRASLNHSSFFCRADLPDPEVARVTRKRGRVEDFDTSYLAPVKGVKTVERWRYLQGSTWNGASLAGADFSAFDDLRTLKGLTVQQWESMIKSPNVQAPVLEKLDGSFIPAEAHPSENTFTEGT